jgi:hypothetical protein
MWRCLRRQTVQRDLGPHFPAKAIGTTPISHCDTNSLVCSRVVKGKAAADVGFSSDVDTLCQNLDAPDLPILKRQGIASYPGQPRTALDTPCLSAMLLDMSRSKRLHRRPLTYRERPPHPLTVSRVWLHILVDITSRRAYRMMAREHEKAVALGNKVRTYSWSRAYSAACKHPWLRHVFGRDFLATQVLTHRGQTVPSGPNPFASMLLSKDGNATGWFGLSARLCLIIR